MNYSVDKNNIILTIPATNDGKFRYKKRKDRLAFGETFSTRNIPFDDQTYLEWQIGYDVPIKDVERDVKTTKLTAITFVGSNKKEKYPYELSEIFFEAMKLRIIAINEAETMLSEIRAYKSFIDEKAITVEHYSRLTMNGLNFEETSIKLPTLFMIDTSDGTQIEVSTQKQQYATGVQPMVYFCIPLRAFRNYPVLLGKPSVSGDKLEYLINKTNVSNLICMMKVFGMASKRHNHDIIEILKILLRMFDRQ